MIPINLRLFFAAKTVAVIGASREPGKIGYSILDSMMQRFQGKVYPVNPNADFILGLKAYKSVKDIEGDVDLAVIAVNTGIVPAVLRECVQKKIGSVIIVTSGYSEVGNKKGEAEIKKIIKGAKTRVIGVNCLGVFDGLSGVDTLFLPEKKMKRPSSGGISFITQSGAFGSTLLDLIASEGIGISKFISYGNQTDLKDVDFLAFLGEDNKTKVIMSYMEAVSDGRKFLEAAKKVSAKKPVIVFKAGKTSKGSQAASSHTGSLAGSYKVYEAAFRQAGVIEAKTVEEMFDFAKALEMQVTGGRRIAVVTNGGGFGVITSDFIESIGLEIADFSANTKAKLKNILPDYAGIHNPLDLVGDADKERYKKSLEVLMADKNVDGIIVVALLQTVSLEPEVIDIIADIGKNTEKPIIACCSGGDYTQTYAGRLEEKGVPVYLTPERAVKAMYALVKYGEIKG